MSKSQRFYEKDGEIHSDKWPDGKTRPVCMYVGRLKMSDDGGPEHITIKVDFLREHGHKDDSVDFNIYPDDADLTCLYFRLPRRDMVEQLIEALRDALEFMEKREPDMAYYNSCLMEHYTHNG